MPREKLINFLAIQIPPKADQKNLSVVNISDFDTQSESVQTVSIHPSWKMNYKSIPKKGGKSHGNELN